MRKKRTKNIKCLCTRDFNVKLKTVLNGWFDISFEKDVWYIAEDLGLSYKIYNDNKNSMLFSVYKGEYLFNDYFLTNNEVKMLELDKC